MRAATPHGPDHGRLPVRGLVRRALPGSRCGSTCPAAGAVGVQRPGQRRVPVPPLGGAARVGTNRSACSGGRPVDRPRGGPWCPPSPWMTFPCDRRSRAREKYPRTRYGYRSVVLPCLRRTPLPCSYEHRHDRARSPRQPARRGDQLRRPSARGGRGPADALHQPAGHADRRRRGRQDPARPAGRRWRCAGPFRTGCGWSSWPSCATRTCVAVTVAEALGIREESVSPDAPGLADFLADQQALLILDNCEQLVAACADLAETLLRACPDLRILADQPAGAADRRRGDADRAAAVGAGAGRARTPRPTWPATSRPACSSSGRRRCCRISTVTEENCATIAALCQALEGMPLAIELAVARLRVLSLEQILERLTDRYRLLTSGTRNAPARQQTLRALIDWSWDLCSARERVLWSRLSVFSGGFELDAAEQICRGRDPAGRVDPRPDRLPGRQVGAHPHRRRPARPLPDARSGPRVRRRPGSPRPANSRGRRAGTASGTPGSPPTATRTGSAPTRRR